MSRTPLACCAVLRAVRARCACARHEQKNYTLNTTKQQQPNKTNSYAHAEARKSPVVDGRVLRTAEGKEVRYPVLLSPQEKEIARIITLAFGQR